MSDTKPERKMPSADERLARVSLIVGGLSDAIEAQCDLGGGICQAHGVDLWEGRCSLAYDLERLRAVIRGESR